MIAGTDTRKTSNVTARRWWANGSPRLIDIVTKSMVTFGVDVFVDMDLSLDLLRRRVEAMRRVLPDAMVAGYNKGVLVFDSEDMSSVLIDCCLYDWLLPESRAA